MTDIDQGRAIATQVLASRRGLMCGVAALGAGGALAACGTAESPSESGGGDTGAGNGADNGGGDGDGGDGRTPLASTSDVPVGGGIVAEETVIVQPSEDEFLAYSAVCPHQGTTVQAPDDEGVITCPNHGSQFDLEGELVQGPAETGLTEVDITVEDGAILLA
ncbi:QcrA and Rieske domain-containing protein [Glycomyces xiaoerkulensis]|uniref:QcrA and Rieske domain-containing protein n=1 Tax=Glycomyces xiaoerkulensis TaxID=2038139 RepID=UPI000C25F1AA|nr:Rieske (2Fe-2S) protein [Glycomyces xiaoerkulensis]